VPSRKPARGQERKQTRNNGKGFVWKLYKEPSKEPNKEPRKEGSKEPSKKPSNELLKEHNF
jgi:hypothetical protein